MEQSELWSVTLTIDFCAEHKQKRRLKNDTFVKKKEETKEGQHTNVIFPTIKEKFQQSFVCKKCKHDRN